MQTATSAIGIVITIITLLILFFLLYSVITANSYTYSKCINMLYIVISLIVCFIFLVLTIMTDYSLTLKIFMVLNVVLIITSLIYAAIQLFSPKCRKRIFYVEWEKSAR